MNTMRLSNGINCDTPSFLTEFDRFFDRAVRGVPVGRQPRVETGFTVRETEEAWHLRADLPGFSRDDVKLDVEEGVLRLTGGIKDEAAGLERKVDRTVRLPEEVDQASIGARLENGMLEVTLPKVVPEKPEPLKIEIN